MRSHTQACALYSAWDIEQNGVETKHVFYLTFNLGWKHQLVSIETGTTRPVFEITLLGPLSQIKWLDEKLIWSA